MDRFREKPIAECHREDRDLVVRIARKSLSNEDRDALIMRFNEVYAELVRTKKTGKLLQDMLLERMTAKELKERLSERNLTARIYETMAAEAGKEGSESGDD